MHRNVDLYRSSSLTFLWQCFFLGSKENRYYSYFMVLKNLVTHSENTGDCHLVLVQFPHLQGYFIIFQCFHYKE